MWIFCGRFGDDHKMNLDQLTDAVLQKLGQTMPRAYVIGVLPEDYDNYIYVNKKPYDVILIGQLQPGQMLRMPSNTVCCALLEGKPVYYCKKQQWYRNKVARALCRELMNAEQRLFRIGVRPIEGQDRLITAKEARDLLQIGKRPSDTRRMTPLARDILEGRQT